LFATASIPVQSKFCCQGRRAIKTDPSSAIKLAHPRHPQASRRLGDQLDFFFVEDLVDFVWLFFLCALLWVVGFAADVSGAVGVVGATAGAFAAGAGAAPEGA
jgi:hypothetical protein